MADNVSFIENNSTENDQKQSIYKLLTRMYLGLKKFLAIIIVIVVISTGLGVGYAAINYKPIYSAKATFSITAMVAKSRSYYNQQTAQKLAETFPAIFTSEPLMNIVAEDLGVAKITDTVSVKFLEDTNMFTVEVFSYSSNSANAVLNSIANNYTKVTKYIIGNSKFNIISEPTLSKSAVNSPNYIGYAISGFAISSFVCFVFLFIYAFGYSYIYNSEDFENNFSTPVLGNIPMIKTAKHNNIGSLLHSVKFLDTIRYIRNSILKSSKNNKIILINSADRNEGSSTVAIATAITLAEKGKKVLLLEANLQTPNLANTFGIYNRKVFFNDVLSGSATLNQAILNMPRINIDVIFSLRESNASHIILSKNFQNKFNDIRNLDYDYIIVDSPASARFTDAFTISAYCDSVILVTSYEGATENDINNSLEYYRATNIDILGSVFNKA